MNTREITKRVSGSIQIPTVSKSHSIPEGKEFVDDFNTQKSPTTKTQPIKDKVLAYSPGSSSFFDVYNDKSQSSSVENEARLIFSI